MGERPALGAKLSRCRARISGGALRFAARSHKSGLPSLQPPCLKKKRGITNAGGGKRQACERSARALVKPKEARSNENERGEGAGEGRSWLLKKNGAATRLLGPLC
jgi:hypothetical protein